LFSFSLVCFLRPWFVFLFFCSFSSLRISVYLFVFCITGFVLFSSVFSALDLFFPSQGLFSLPLNILYCSCIRRGRLMLLMLTM
jgi:hypothetical protein